MKARLLGAMFAAALLVMPAAYANHPQGCNPLGQLGLPNDPTGVRHDCPPPPPDDQPQKLSGCAYGAYANVTNPLTSANAVLNNVAPANFVNYIGGPSAGPALKAPCPMNETYPAIKNFAAAASLPLGPSPVGVSAGTLTTSSQGLSAGYGAASHALSSATTQSVTIAVPLASLTIKADVVRAVAYCTKVASGPGRDDTGPAGFGPAKIAGLTIAHPLLPGGQLVFNALPAEDTWIPIPGVGGIMLRETWDLGVAPGYTSFTENMIHIYFYGNLIIAGDVVISQAHCDGMNLTGRAPQFDGQIG